MSLTNAKLARICYNSNKLEERDHVQKSIRKRLIAFVCSVLAISTVVGSWAYYSSTNALDNQLKTKKYGNQLEEKFTPKDDWQPGELI